MKSQHREKNIVKLAEKIPASIPGEKNLLCKVTHRRSWLQSRGKGRAGGSPGARLPERRQVRKTRPRLA